MSGKDLLLLSRAGHFRRVCLCTCSPWPGICRRTSVARRLPAMAGPLARHIRARPGGGGACMCCYCVCRALSNTTAACSRAHIDFPSSRSHNGARSTSNVCLSHSPPAFNYTHRVHDVCRQYKAQSRRGSFAYTLDCLQTMLQPLLGPDRCLVTCQGPSSRPLLQCLNRIVLSVEYLCRTNQSQQPVPSRQVSPGHSRRRGWFGQALFDRCITL